MNTLPNLTPEQAIWGRFYKTLHEGVLRLEAIANGDTRQDDPKAMANSAKLVKPTRPGDHTTLAGEKKAGG